jgi:hypothetical protein
MIFCIQVGNSDNRLTQSQWRDFCNDIHKLIQFCEGHIHFSAPSVGWADWQNACWVFELPEDNSYLSFLKFRIKDIRELYKQESIAWFCGKLELL